MEGKVREMKSIFLICLSEANESVSHLIQENYSDSFEYSPTLYLVVDECLAEALAKKVGIKGEDRIADASGFVVKLGEFSYSGYTMRSLWDWFREAQKQS